MAVSIKFLNLAVIALALLLPHSANAFQILSAVSSACHENMTLGTVGYGPSAFQGSPSASSLVTRFVNRVNQVGVPGDDATQALIKENVARYGWSGLDAATQYVLTSFVAGAREPDTHGFSIIDINHIRDNHMTDSAQPIHMLRTRANDGDQGNRDAIATTRAGITAFLNGVLTDWANGASPISSQLWSFPFYGEQTVQIFTPAFNLGQVAHSIEDSYAHTIRDDQFNILAVSNYIEVMTDDLDESRDGPPHSERLDQCNTNDTFDNFRIQEVRRQLTQVFTLMDGLLGSGSTDDSSVETQLNTTFVYRSGCTVDSQYCGVQWAEKSREQVSKPYKLGLNCGLVKSIDPKWPNGPLLIVSLLALLSPILLALKLRKRA